MNWTRVMLLTVVILFPCASAATETGMVIKFAFDTGGGYVGVPGPNGEQIDRAQLGYGPSFGGGVSLLNDAKTVEGEFTLMWLSSTSSCEGRSCPPPPPDRWSWDRFPFNALVLYRWNKLRLGGGLTYDVYQRLQGFGNEEGLNALNVKSEPGAILEMDWRISYTLNLGVRYTKQYYRESTGARLDGGAIGVVFTVSGHRP